MIHFAICDDNAIYLDTMNDLVQTWAKEHQLDVEILLFQHGDALLDACQTHKMDLILLDIMMPLLNGMDTAKEIRKSDTTVKLVFFTTAPEFAVESYDVKASGYLLKPIQKEKLFRVLTDCLEDFRQEPEHIIVKTHTSYRKVYLDHIHFIEAQNKKVLLYLDKDEMIEAWDTFANFADSLTEEKGFFKCHRSYIVNMSNVNRFNTNEIIIKNGVHIPIARTYTKAFKDAYFDFMFKKGSEIHV